MNDRNIKHVMGKKSPSPYPERKKKPRLKFSWNKEQTIDYSKSKQIDIFIQDVIEKAKEDYLQTYIQGNGQCIDHNYTGMYILIHGLYYIFKTILCYC